jgi:hypothetical protein
MKKRFLYIGVLTLISVSSCSEPDKICDCIAAGDVLNKKSAEILSKVPTKKDEKEIVALRKEKAKKCKDFEKMAGPEMLKRKQTCESN